MNIVWLCNKPPSIVQKICKLPINVYGGWLDNMCEIILNNEKNNLFIFFPGKRVFQEESKNLKCFCFKERNCKDYFSHTLNKIRPDIIHIWGTEYIHTEKMVDACIKLDMIDKCIISIQGLVSICGKYHFTEGVLNKYIYKYTLRDFIFHDNIRNQRNKFLKNGKSEIRALKKVKHVIGRTDWDKAIIQKYNPNATYHFCNESLRNSFYNASWDVTYIKRHSIFLSQCNYPIKGFHYMLEAMQDIIEEYPDAHIYTTGRDLIHLSLWEKIKVTVYQKYLIMLINKYSLRDKVTFLGTLSEKEMCSWYKCANVFVSPSTIENSSNSIGEAMLIGCPVVSSDVGGIKNLLIHEKEGYIYQSSAPYMLSYYIKCIFSDIQKTEELSRNAKIHAKNTHDQEKNITQLLNIYDSITNNI